MHRCLALLFAVSMVACSDVAGVTCSSKDDCEGGADCKDGICVQRAFDDLVLDSPAPDSTLPQTFEVKAHLVRHPGVEASAPASVVLLATKAGSEPQEIALPLLEDASYAGSITLASTGPHQLKMRSGELALESAIVTISVVPGCEDHADCPVCQACREGRCVAQSDREDLKNECPEAPCATGLCDGTGACGLKSSTTVCRPAAGNCDIEEVCTGDASACPPDQLQPATVVCREASSACDLEETCSGESAVCPEDAFAPATTVCRPSAGDCDAEETCSGLSATCPDDGYLPSTHVCRNATNECDLAESCTGAQATCPEDEKQPLGHLCADAICAVTDFTPASTCDESGVCITPPAASCGDYVCDGAGCKTSCSSDADCVTGLCDRRDGTCSSSFVEVDCAVDGPSALQAAIDACVAGTTCYLRLADGVCDKVVIQAKDVYVSGTPSGMIDPSSDGPAISVLENSGETTRVGLAGLRVRGASGAAGDGLNCTGLAGGEPEVALIDSVIGGPEPGAGNAGAGISASNASVTVSGSAIQNNAGTGLSLVNSDFSITSTLVALNGQTSGSWGVDVFANTEATRQDFRANTVVNNGAGGMSCAGLYGAAAISGSLFWNPSGTEMDSCSADSTSDIPGFQDACNNGDATEPGFVKLSPPDADYHLQLTSPCIDKIACDPLVATDADGDARPQPAGGLCDVGADEAL